MLDEEKMKEQDKEQIAEMSHNVSNEHEILSADEQVLANAEAELDDTNNSELNLLGKCFYHENQCCSCYTQFSTFASNSCHKIE